MFVHGHDVKAIEPLFNMVNNGYEFNIYSGGTPHGKSQKPVKTD